MIDVVRSFIRSMSNSVALQVEKKRLAGVIYPFFRDPSVNFVNEFEDYFLGGMGDMAVWTQIVWDKYLVMLRNGSCTDVQGGRQFKRIFSPKICHNIDPKTGPKSV